MRRLLLVAVLLAACGGSVQTSSSVDGGAGSSGAAGEPGFFNDPVCGAGGDPTKCIEPPPRPDVPANPQSGNTSVVAVSRFYFGDTDRNGVPSPTAWKEYGYNLDGIISSKTDTNHCKLVTGANPVNVKTDGNGGIDNSFGSNLLSLVTSLDPTFGDDVNARIKNGHFTVLLQIHNLRDTTTYPDQTGMTAALFRGADKGSPAALDGTDVWPAAWDYTQQGNPALPVDFFADSYVAKGVWVSGFLDGLHFPLDLFTTPLDLDLGHAVVTMEITGSGANARATRGVVAGVMDTEQFITRLKQASYDAYGCIQPPFDSIAEQIREASDIMKDGSNGDPSKTCDGISIGLGFDGVAAELGTVAPPEPPPPDPCAPAP